MFASDTHPLKNNQIPLPRELSFFRFHISGVAIIKWIPPFKVWKGTTMGQLQNQQVACSCWAQTLGGRFCLMTHGRALANFEGWLQLRLCETGRNFIHGVVLYLTGVLRLRCVFYCLLQEVLGLRFIFYRIVPDVSSLRFVFCCILLGVLSLRFPLYFAGSLQAQVRFLSYFARGC